MGLGVDGGGDVEVRVKTGLLEKTGREGGKKEIRGLRVGSKVREVMICFEFVYT